MCGKPQVLRHRSNITTFMRLVPVNVTMPKKGNPEAVRFLNDLIGKLIANGFIGASLKKHKVDQKLSIPDN